MGNQNKLNQEMIKELNSEVRRAKIEIIGKDDIKNDAQARTAITIIKVYGGSSSGFIYFEPCNIKSNKRPQDIFLCHPDVGILCIEVKGWIVDQIQRICAGSFFVENKNWSRPFNPIRQAEDSIFDIINLLMRNVKQHHTLPISNVLVALPNICESDLKRKKLLDSIIPDHYLFKEDLNDIEKTKNKINALVQSVIEESKKKTPLSIDHINLVKKVFGDSAVVNEKRERRNGISEETLGSYIDELACALKNLSTEQQYLSRLPMNGHPRLIRGVAGSGKTIVLANMAATFYKRKINSDSLFESHIPKIAVLCFNRSLVKLIKNKISDAYYQKTQKILNEKNIIVKHLNGFMYYLARQKNFFNYIRTKDTNPSYRAAIYLKYIQDLKNIDPIKYEHLLFDAIFIDEGQDFAPEEYKLLQELVTTGDTNEKNLVIFYDDAQNVYGRFRPAWKDLGIDVQRKNRSRIMKECFRNTKEIVEFSFNILTGKQSNFKERVSTRTFADVNFLKQNDMILEKENYFEVKFSKRTFMKPYLKSFSNRAEEKEWVSNQIVYSIYKEQVRPQDILILFNQEKDFEDLDNLIKSKDTANKILGFIKPYGDETNNDKDRYIFKENHLTISTIKGAKGYDTYCVFLVGLDTFTLNNQSRASFYVGATRAKLTLCVTGIYSDYNLFPEAFRLYEKLYLNGLFDDGNFKSLSPQPKPLPVEADG